jgi:cysteine desulfurase
VTVAPVDERGIVDPAMVFEAIDDDTAVVSVMLANNETGAQQPVQEVVTAAAGRVVVHTDAVQAFVSEQVDVGELGVDLLSLASHKVGGPKGVGILYVRDGTLLEPVLHGGGQELGRRSGTHNVMGVVGMVAAMQATVEDRARLRTEIGRARGVFEAGLEDLAARTVPVDRTLLQHSHLQIAGTRNETLLVRLDRAGVAASAASACQSGAATVSHVLSAMGMAPREARECIRFSFGWTSTVAEAEKAASIVRETIEATS